jgi:Tol biopolymer transport system component
MSLSPGTRLGPYEIVRPLGSGGMGEVFVGSDSRLGRSVAIKILRQELTSDADRARFRREARTIASLTHAHICTLHDVGTHEGLDFLVMELLEGETLAARLARGPLSVENTLEYAIQIASALDGAHRLGIVHRDLKPANVMLTKSGVKLFDFGLARLQRSEARDSAETRTRSADLTEKGTILGTPQYMAPEQLEGKETDARTDLFAFGAIVYEMATGRRAFTASSRVGLVAAVLESDPPPLTTIKTAAPPALERVVKICLAKNPDDRWSTAHDALLLLRSIGADGPRALTTASVRRARVPTWIVAAAFLVGAILVTAWMLWPQTAQPLDFVSVLPPAGTSLAVGEAPQISPDGRHVVFPATDGSGKTLLYVRTRGTLSARPLPDTEDGTLPFWSPDSQRLGFFSRGNLKTTAISGGRAQTIAPSPVPRGGTWGRDGVIVFVPFPNTFPQQVSATGGTVTQVPIREPSNERRWFPSFLPDGRHYLYLSIDVTRRLGTAIRVASLDAADTTEVMPSTTNAVYAAPGYLIFRRDQALVAQQFDLRQFALSGTPSIVVESVGFSPISYQGFFSASTNGALAYLESDPGWHLVWFDRSGRRDGEVVTIGQYNSVCFSADGRRIVYDRADIETGNVDIWTLDLAIGRPSRLTFDPSVDFTPVCSPAADEVVFSTLRAGVPTLFRQNVSAPGTETLLRSSQSVSLATDWSRDGRLIVYSTFDPRTTWDIWVLPLAGGQPAVFAATAAEERNARLSPDGRWIAYAFRESQQTEVFAQPFPAAGTKWQVSPAGGSYPVWSPDGRELFYLSADQKIVGVTVTAGTSGLTFGPPQVILETRVVGWERITQGSPFAVTPDGRRFLVSSAGDAVTPITLVQNWTSAPRK